MMLVFTQSGGDDDGLLIAINALAIETVEEARSTTPAPGGTVETTVTIICTVSGRYVTVQEPADQVLRMLELVNGETR